MITVMTENAVENETILELWFVIKATNEVANFYVCITASGLNLPNEL